MIRKGIKLLLIVLWMGLIFAFSMDSGVASSKKSHSIVVQVGEFITHRKLSDSEKKIMIEKYETPIRKSAHFFLYFVLELLVLWLIIEFHPLTRKDYLLSLLFILLYASTDEVHQLFVMERSGEVLDVMIDTFGGIISSLSVYLIKNKKKKSIS